MEEEKLIDQKELLEDEENIAKEIHAEPPQDIDSLTKFIFDNIKDQNTIVH